mgnify:FL=1
MIRNDCPTYKVESRLEIAEEQKKRGHGFTKALCKKAKLKRRK